MFSEKPRIAMGGVVRRSGRTLFATSPLHTGGAKSPGSFHVRGNRRRRPGMHQADAGRLGQAARIQSCRSQAVASTQIRTDGCAFLDRTQVRNCRKAGRSRPMRAAPRGTRAGQGAEISARPSSVIVRGMSRLILIIGKIHRTPSCRAQFDRARAVPGSYSPAAGNGKRQGPHRRPCAAPRQRGCFRLRGPQYQGGRTPAQNGRPGRTIPPATAQNCPPQSALFRKAGRSRPARTRRSAVLHPQERGDAAAPISWTITGRWASGISLSSTMPRPTDRREILARQPRCPPVPHRPQLQGSYGRRAAGDAGIVCEHYGMNRWCPTVDVTNCWSFRIANCLTIPQLTILFLDVEG